MVVVQSYHSGQLVLQVGGRARAGGVCRHAAPVCECVYDRVHKSVLKQQGLLVSYFIQLNSFPSNPRRETYVDPMLV